MREIELKILNIEKDDLERKLLGLGAKRVSEELIIEKHFDFSDHRITFKRNLFRLRKIGEKKVEIAYKDSKSKDKDFLIFEETETEVKDFASMEKIIAKIGLKCIKHREKKRTSFATDKLKFEIDQYPLIPAYLEIEGPKREIKRALKLLKIEFRQTVSLTGTEVLKSYGVNSDFQRF